MGRNGKEGGSVRLFVLINLFFIFSAGAVDTITAQNTYKLLSEKKAIIVDVREVSEQDEGRVKDALSLPMSVMDKDHAAFDKLVATLPKDKNIIVYCRSGRRSGLVGAELEKKGLKVSNMGTFDSWKSEKLPTETKK